MANIKRKSKLLSIIALICIPLLFTGCFSYSDINKVTFATSIIFDTDDFNQAVVYLDCIKPYRSTNDSSDKGRRLIYKGTGKTALEALQDISRISSYKLDYSQIRAYIFTEEASKKGVNRFLDLINNDYEFQVKPSAFVYYGDIDDLLDTVSTDEEYLGLFLNDLVGKDKYNPRSVKSNINYYMSNILMGSDTALMTSIDLKEDAIDKKIEINGASIFKENKLVDKMDLEDSFVYNMLMGPIKAGTLEVSNPDSKEDFVTLEILDSNVKNNIEYIDGRIKLYKDIEVDVIIGEIQGNLIVDNEALDYIKVNKEAYINGYAQYVFDKYKEKGLDIFDIKRMMEIYYPNENIDDVLSITDLVVNTRLVIKGTGVSRNSL